MTHRPSAKIELLLEVGAEHAGLDVDAAAAVPVATASLLPGLRAPLAAVPVAARTVLRDRAALRGGRLRTALPRALRLCLLLRPARLPEAGQLMPGRRPGQGTSRRGELESYTTQEESCVQFWRAIQEVWTSAAPASGGGLYDTQGCR